MTPGEAFEGHLDLARRIAGAYMKKLPSFMQPREVEQAALLGLWDAALRHHALPPEQFRAVASARISGSIADEYRSHDPIPRGSRRGHGALFRMVYVDSIEGLDYFGEYAIPMPDMEGAIDESDRWQWLFHASGRLPKQQRVIIRRLLRGERQNEVGLALGLTQARVSQIVRVAVQELRRKLQSRHRRR